MAGRRIYKYLGSVIEKLRLERQGEINRAAEICIDWDVDTIEYTHDVWDMLMDESLLENPMNRNDATEHSQDVGVLSIVQMAHLGLCEAFKDLNIIREKDDLVTCFVNAIAEEEMETGQNMKLSDEITFVVFARVLHQCLQPKHKHDEQNSPQRIRNILQRLEQYISKRCSDKDGDDTSKLLATTAIHSDNNTVCKKRQRHSDRFDEYVATFKVWEDKFVGKHEANYHSLRRIGKLRNSRMATINK